eukprot:2478164-Amphidinium_carterae.1
MSFLLRFYSGRMQTKVHPKAPVALHPASVETETHVEIDTLLTYFYTPCSQVPYLAGAPDRGLPTCVGTAPSL